MKGLDFPAGVRHALIDSLSRVPLRYFIIDDSASMTASDGTIHFESAGKQKSISCSRWTELTTAMRFHLELVYRAMVPCEFRMLNCSDPIRIGFGFDAGDSHSGSGSSSSGGSSGAAEEEQRYQRLLHVFEETPTGCTPLCRHITDIIADLRQHVPALRAQGAKAVITIATDGLASDGDIAEAMRPLKDLPVSVVLRLCTSEERVVDFWNRVDAELELNMDVIDDIVGEAQEVRRLNPWLTYGEPLHRIREFGVNVKELDLLDETVLSTEQVRRVCHLIYGGNLSDYPNMEADLEGFCEVLQNLNGVTPSCYCFVRQALRPWVDVSLLRGKYKKGCGCTVS